MKIILEPSQITPFIRIDPDTGRIVIRGQSSLEKAPMFYHPLVKKIYDLFNGTNKDIKVDISLKYFNTSSSKCFLDLFRVLKKLQQNGSKVDVEWCYEKNDLEMRETGEDYADLVEMDFSFIEILTIDRQYLRKAV